MEEKKELLRIEHLTVSFAQYEKRSAKQGELPVIRDLIPDYAQVPGF